ncbi:MAG: hypothetical protein QG639_958 [Patescibacteria group bacterium]|nr:hypothetical protein [Patescibacteria group bacterium]
MQMMKLLARLPKKVRQKLPLLIVVVASLAYTIIFSLIALHRFWQYEAWYYDFGIFARAIYLASQFKEPVIDHFVVGGKSIFADHFHPIILLLAPVFWFTSHAEVLLVIQALTVGVSGIFIYLTAQAVLKNITWSMCLMLVYFSFIGLHFALISEFHEIALLPLPLSIFFYAMVTKKIKLYVLATCLVLLVKESTFIIPAFFTFLEIIKSNGTWRKINIVLLLLSILYGILAIKVVIPYFSQGEYQYSDQLNASAFEKVLDTPLKIKTIWQTLASFGFLPLLAPELLLPVLFNWFTRFSADSISRHGMALHYNAEVAPTLLLATIFALQRLKKYIKREGIVTTIVVVATLWSGYFSLIHLDSPIRLAILSDFYSHTQSFEFLDTLVAKVPKEGLVMTQTNLAPRLIDRNILMLRIEYEEFSPDWIVVDTRQDQNANNFYGATRPGASYPTEVFEKLDTDPNYEVYYQQGEQIIYRKKN